MEILIQQNQKHACYYSLKRNIIMKNNIFDFFSFFLKKKKKRVDTYHNKLYNKCNLQIVCRLKGDNSSEKPFKQNFIIGFCTVDGISTSDVCSTNG